MSRASAIILTGYVLLHLFTIFVTDRCLYENIQEKKYKRFRALWLVLYILGALVPIAGAFVNIESVKYPLQAVGNVILGYDLYYSGFLLIFSVILLLAAQARMFIDIPKEKIPEAAKALLRRFNEHHNSLCLQIDHEPVYSEELKARILEHAAHFFREYK